MLVACFMEASPASHGFGLLCGCITVVLQKCTHSDPALQTYVNRSLVGAIIGGVVFAAWVIAVQSSWQQWLPESWMLVIPEAADDL